MYDNQHEASYLAKLQYLEDLHKKAFEAEAEAYLSQASPIRKGSVVEVAPHPRQYFSRSRRFLVLQVAAHLGRDQKTGHYAGVIPAVVGVFLKDDGAAWQPIQKKPLDVGAYYTESLTLANSKYLAGSIERLAEDQSHQILLGT